MLRPAPPPPSPQTQPIPAPPDRERELSRELSSAAVTIASKAALIADLEAARKIAGDREVTLRDTVNELRANLVKTTSRAEAAADATNDAHGRALDQHRADVDQAREAARQLEIDIGEGGVVRLPMCHTPPLLASPLPPCLPLASPLPPRLPHPPRPLLHPVPLRVGALTAAAEVMKGEIATLSTAGKALEAEVVALKSDLESERRARDTAAGDLSAAQGRIAELDRCLADAQMALDQAAQEQTRQEAAAREERARVEQASEVDARRMAETHREEVSRLEEVRACVVGRVGEGVGRVVCGRGGYTLTLPSTAAQVVAGLKAKHAAFHEEMLASGDQLEVGGGGSDGYTAPSSLPSPVLFPPSPPPHPLPPSLPPVLTYTGSPGLPRAPSRTPSLPPLTPSSPASHLGSQSIAR